MARKSLVLELQEMATDRRNDVSDLLRKALDNSGDDNSGDAIHDY